MFHVKRAPGFTRPVREVRKAAMSIETQHDAPITAALDEALSDLSATVPPRATALLALHWDLMIRWNARTNLTAITAPRQGAWLHYRDSLALLPYLCGGPVVDFGSGAGFPGIPLAVVRPEWRFTLVEPRRKRVSFLESAVARLGLKNVTVRMGRLEDAPDQAYAHAVTRATFSDTAMLRRADPWLRRGGTLLALRAAPAEGEKAHATHEYQLLGTTRCIDVWTFSDELRK
jgi:16S rRNA (guanine527-N7)-methyltransferase